MDDEQQIRDLIATWLRLSAEGDINQILPLMAEDASFWLRDSRRYAGATHSPLHSPDGKANFVWKLNAKSRRFSSAGIWATVGPNCQ
jgi:hypothetical protein